MTFMTQEKELYRVTFPVTMMADAQQFIAYSSLLLLLNNKKKKNLK